MPGGPGLGTGDKAENKTASPCPWGAHGAEKEAKQTPNQEMTMQGDEGCAKGALGGGGRSGGTEGGLAQPWQEPLWLFSSLLSTEPRPCWGQECVLTERQRR